MWLAASARQSGENYQPGEINNRRNGESWLAKKRSARRKRNQWLAISCQPISNGGISNGVAAHLKAGNGWRLNLLA